jgi:aminoglycoside phosphotransferase (APT) family kinase protein
VSGPLELLLAGDEFDTWLLRDGTVVKLPRSPYHADKVPIERALHPVLRAHLGDVVPALRIAGEPDGRFPFPYLGYEPARGVPLQRAEGSLTVPTPRLAAELGEVLGDLHAIALDEVLPAGVGVRPLSVASLALGAETIEGARAAAGDAVVRFLDDPLPPPFVGPLVLCHTDLKGEHVWVDPDTGRLASLIDWADAERCDPAKDLGDLAIVGGEAFVREVATAAGADRVTIDRAIWLGRAGILRYVDGAGEITPLVEAQLRVAFSA